MTAIPGAAGLDRETFDGGAAHLEIIDIARALHDAGHDHDATLLETGLARDYQTEGTSEAWIAETDDRIARRLVVARTLKSMRGVSSVD